MFMQLIHNDDPTDYYKMIPRLGAFEVTAVVTQPFVDKNTQKEMRREIPILFWSKFQSRIWPNAVNLADRIHKFYEEIERYEPMCLQTKYKFARKHVKPSKWNGFDHLAPYMKTKKQKVAMKTMREAAAQEHVPADVSAFGKSFTTTAQMKRT